MSCGEFARNIEQYLSEYVDQAGENGGSGMLPEHLQTCRRCAERWRQALASHRLLATLREPAAEPDPYFLTRVQARIAQINRPAPRWQARFAAQIGAARRDLVLAAAVLAITLGSFYLDLQRTETPSIAEAVALDVPHVHWRHPSQDHGPGATDVLLSLLNR